MEKTALNIDIKQEQLKAQEELKKQGLRVLVCAGTGCCQWFIKSYRKI